MHEAGCGPAVGAGMGGHSLLIKPNSPLPWQSRVGLEDPVSVASHAGVTRMTSWMWAGPLTGPP